MVAAGAMQGRASGVTTIGLEVVKIVMVTHGLNISSINMYHGLTREHPQSAVATGSQAMNGSPTKPAMAGGVGGTNTQSAVATGSQAIDGSDPSQL